eukprot:TRINITY_DN13476_c0_g2_i1.p2 TRINITY_DN13476_c0_g2~~TRINITY_DN13476_c0_g2_i1.p2  ORF type:complete len:305 (-),score=41.97 TRINITY_DN13476_c0_g2_i1:408-1235(-)
MVHFMASRDPLEVDGTLTSHEPAAFTILRHHPDVTRRSVPRSGQTPRSLPPGWAHRSPLGRCTEHGGGTDHFVAKHPLCGVSNFVVEPRRVFSQGRGVDDGGQETPNSVKSFNTERFLDFVRTAGEGDMTPRRDQTTGLHSARRRQLPLSFRTTNMDTYKWHDTSGLNRGGVHARPKDFSVLRGQHGVPQLDMRQPGFSGVADSLFGQTGSAGSHTVDHYLGGIDHNDHRITSGDASGRGEHGGVGNFGGTMYGGARADSVRSGGSVAGVSELNF